MGSIVVVVVPMLLWVEVGRDREWRRPRGGKGTRDAPMEGLTNDNGIAMSRVKNSSKVLIPT